MEAMEVIAVIILIVAIAVLVYYYLLNSPATMDKLRSYVPTSADSQSDIDMSALNTDAFSNKIDAFLDAKSEELIKDWSLATTEDVEDLQAKFSETTANVDSLEKDFIEFRKSSEEFQKSTEEKLNDLDKRIESLENN